MSRDSIKRQLCLLLSIITMISGMCLLSQQADACFSSSAQGSWVFFEKGDFAHAQGTNQGGVLLSWDTISAPVSSCTVEMLGVRRILSAQQSVRRFLGSLRNKIILALSFVGLFLFILILFSMAVDQFGFCHKPGHTAIVQYIHSQDGKKPFHYNMKTADLFGVC